MICKSQVLKNLQQVKLPQSGTTQDEYGEFYRALYLPAWELLSPTARNLLICLAIFPVTIGGNFDALQAVSGIMSTELNTYVRELWQFSLMETQRATGAGLREPRYVLHPLTQYFVKSEIAQGGAADQRAFPQLFMAGVGRYVDYFLTQLATQARQYRQLDTEAENLLEAVTRAFRAAPPARAIQSANQLAHYLFVRGRYGQAQQVLEQADAFAADPVLQAAYTTSLVIKGRILLRQGLLTEAHALLETALGYATQQQDALLQADVLQVMADVAINRGDYPAATANLQRALALVQPYKDQHRLAQLLYTSGRVACFTADFEEANQSLQRALKIAQGLADNELIIPILLQQSTAAGMQAEFATAERSARQALAAAEALQHREWMGGALRNLSSALIALGQYAEGEECVHRGVKIARDIGHLEMASGLLNNLAVSIGNRGYLENDLAKLEQALGYYREGLELVREQGNRERIRSFLTNVGATLTFLGKLEQAEHDLLEADELAHALENSWAIGDTQIALGKLRLAQGNLALADQAFRIALEAANQAALPEVQADALWGLGKVAEAQHDLGAARSLGLESLQVLEQIQLHEDATALRAWLNQLR